MVEKAIWLDIAQVCVHIFTSHRRVKIQHKSAIKYGLLNMGKYSHAGLWEILWASIQGI